LFKDYLTLTKPGIIIGNAIPAIAGFFVASQGTFNVGICLAMLAGLSLIIASSCIFNNYIDRNIDSYMHRTRNRALVQKRISVRNAISYAIIVGITGTLILYVYTNVLTMLIALMGAFIYIVLYGMAKRHSIFGTEVGSIAGAVPPVVGYTAVANTFDAGALLLFMLLVFWQMPHFFAIAIYRKDEYAAASIPVLTVIKGNFRAKIAMCIYTILFVIATIALYIFHYTHGIYLFFAIILDIYWLSVCFRGFGAVNDNRWARKMFGISLLVLTALSYAMVLDAILPLY
jgi:protoheme IX farnesyltransferase